MTPVAILPEVLDQVVIDTSGTSPRYIAVSHNKKHMQLSPLAYMLLEKVSAGSSFGTIAQDMLAEGQGQITPEELQQAYKSIVEKISKIDGEQVTRRKDFWLKFSLIPAESVQVVAADLAFMFHPLVVFVALSSLAILTAYVLVHGLLVSVIGSNPIMIIPAYLLFLVSLFAHEFGHASACYEGGVEPSEIGAAIYLFFPVFYSDVSTSWQLSRWRKVRVDIGGIYFQLCVGAIYLLLYCITKQSVFQTTFLMLVGSCLLSLNPLMKFDGYWVITDLLNVSNLYKQPLYIFVHFYQVLVQKRRRTLRWSPGVCVVILLYGVLRTAFWIYILALFLPYLWRSALAYPALIGTAIEHVQRYGTGTYLMADLQGLVMNGLFIFLYGVGFFRMSIPAFKKFVTSMQKGKQESTSALGQGSLS